MNVSKKKIQYPPQTGPYKVCVKDKNNWFGHNTARLQISIDNPKQDGVKLFAMTEWAAARFDKVIFIVSDTLQRHNIALRHGISLQDAHGLALTQGYEWMARNKAAIDLVPRRVVTVWDDWLLHPDYAATRQEINALYEHNAAFREAVMKVPAGVRCQDEGGGDGGFGVRSSNSASWILSKGGVCSTGISISGFSCDG